MWLQWRWTGASGFAGIDRGPTSTNSTVTLVLCVGIAGAACVVCAPILAIRPTLEVAQIITPVSVQVLGVLLVLAGMTGTLWAQFAMGRAWRIGQNPAERTELVTGGPFRWIRNPIFTAVIIFAAGIGLLLPNMISLIGVLLVAAAIELQVRTIEEPHLRRLHAEAYATWAAHTGRFLPYVGRCAPR